MDAARTEPGTRGKARRKARVLNTTPVVDAAPELRGAPEQRVAGEPRIDTLHAEASAAISYSANTMRSVRELYRAAYNDELRQWKALSDELDELDALERRAAVARPRIATTSRGEPTDDTTAAAAEAAETGAEDARVRALRTAVGSLGHELGSHQTELAKLDVALRNLETMWLFLTRGDTGLAGGGQALPTDIQMRIVEAKESERSRLAQEIHDGPAQVLSNAIFQVEYIERVMATDESVARSELRFLREQLRRELGSVRTFISQLRPPVLDELGLEGAVADAVARTTALTGLAISTDLAAPSDRLAEGQQTVVLRVVQEALQNVRKHGGASSVIVASVIEGEEWVLTVRDDGRGFDVGAVAARGRRNFGLQFMHERAELIGAHFEVQSRPDGGTVVRLAIPMGT